MASNVEREASLRRRFSNSHLVRLKVRPLCLTSVDSTQDYLIKELPNSAEGDFVVSDIQTRGRGREGRTWYSDLGGLYLSLTLAPEKSNVLDQIVYIIAKAIIETLERDFHLVDCVLKAPNDVICHGRKIAGVLVDAEVKGEKPIAYAGIGIDLNNGECWRGEMRNFATSYFLETGRKVDLDEFIVKLFQRLDKGYDQLMSRS